MKRPVMVDYASNWLTVGTLNYWNFQVTDNGTVVTTYNNAKWVGFMKTTKKSPLAAKLEGYIAMIALFTFHSLVTYRQQTVKCVYFCLWVFLLLYFDSVSYLFSLIIFTLKISGKGRSLCLFFFDKIKIRSMFISLQNTSSKSMKTSD